MSFRDVVGIVAVPFVLASSLLLLAFLIDLNLLYLNNFVSFPLGSALILLSYIGIIAYVLSTMLALYRGEFVYYALGLVVGVCLFFFAFPVLVSPLTSLQSSETSSLLVDPDVVSNATFALEEEIFLRVNDLRVDRGFAVLTFDEDLARLARSHSSSMVSQGFFSHRSPNGDLPTDRARKAGISVFKDLPGGSYLEGVGENIASMPTGKVLGSGFVEDTPESVADAIVARWMESPAHRANILSSVYDRAGVGVAFDGSAYLATQNFI